MQTTDENRTYQKIIIFILLLISYTGSWEHFLQNLNETKQQKQRKKKYLCKWNKCLKKHCICIEKQEVHGQPFSWQIWECTRPNEQREIEWSTPATRRKEREDKRGAMEITEKQIQETEGEITGIDEQIEKMGLYEHVGTCDCHRYKTVERMIKNMG